MICDAIQLWRFNLTAPNQDDISHATLHRILGLCLDLPPESVEIETDRFGKPRLGPVHQEKRVFFNLAHTHSIALVGVSHRAEVGVDVEMIETMEITESLLAVICSPVEIERLHALPTAQWRRAALRCWTRKEAVLKACGQGVRIEPSRFTVGFSTRPATAILPDGSLWRVAGLPDSDAASSALARKLVANKPQPPFAATLFSVEPYTLAPTAPAVRFDFR